MSTACSPLDVGCAIEGARKADGRIEDCRVVITAPTLPLKILAEKR
jgi:hypothetical protein